MRLSSAVTSTLALLCFGVASQVRAELGTPSVPLPVQSRIATPRAAVPVRTPVVRPFGTVRPPIGVRPAPSSKATPPPPTGKEEGRG